MHKNIENISNFHVSVWKGKLNGSIEFSQTISTRAYTSWVEGEIEKVNSKWIVMETYCVIRLSQIKLGILL